MTVKARIALGIAVLLVVIVLIGGLAVYFFERIASSVDQAAGEAYTRLDLAQSLSSEASYLLTPPANGTSARRDLDERRVRFAERLRAHAAELFRRPLSSVDGLVIADLERDASVIIARTTQRVDSTRGMGVAAAIADVDRLLRGVYTDNAVILERELALVSERAERGRTSIGFLLIICVTFSLGVLIWLPRYVARPIQDFSQSISRITAGNYKTRLRVGSRDEFGRLAADFNRMAAELEAGSTESQAAVLESQARLSALVDQLDELILGMDAGRLIVFVNAAMARYLEVEPEEVLGQYMPDLALGRPRVQQLFRPIALGTASAIEPFAVEEADGRSRYLQERVIRLRDPESDVDGDYIILLTDVTEYEQRTHDQTDFLAAMSHEMKTPIAAINMSVRLLEDERLGRLDDDQLELTGTVKKNVARLLRMINEVLELSASESGTVKLELSQLDIGAIIAEATDSVAPLAEAKDIGLDCERPDGEYRLEVDGERIASAITNLLTNAIRYAPPGGSVVVELAPVTGGVCLTVTDDGPGVRPADRERIFGRYKRGAGDATEGTGLGLAISRESVEAHGGRLYVDAAYGPGARFVLELPRRLSQSKRTQQLAGA